MTRLLQIEWLKLKYNRAFWILTGMYVFGVTLICSSAMLLMEWFKSEGADFDEVDPTILPLYDFPDVWQNITYIATFLKVILGFIVIISISNEASYRTLRQNIIDGLSKKEFLISKLLLIGIMSIGTMILLFTIGMVTGLIYSHILGAKYIFSEMQFLFAYGLEVFVYLTFALMIALLVRKTGLVIVGMLMYTVAFEPFLAMFIEHFPYISDDIRWIRHGLPIRALNNLIHVPYLKYAFQETQDYVSFREVAVVLGWLAINVGLSYTILKKRDL